MSHEFVIFRGREFPSISLSLPEGKKKENGLWGLFAYSQYTVSYVRSDTQWTIVLLNAEKLSSENILTGFV